MGTHTNEWMTRLREGDINAAVLLWDKYFQRMMSVAKHKLSNAHRTARDEEDIALSAFKSFCLGVQHGRFKRPNSGADLWPLLVSLTVNKAIDHLRHENRKKRGGSGKAEVDGRRAVDESRLPIEILLAADTSPEQQALADEWLESLIEMLDKTGDLALSTIAILRLEDQSPVEIAEVLGCTARTVQRKLKTIQAIWQASDS